VGLIERERETEARRKAESQRVFGHTGASIPGAWFDWRAEALSLEAENARLRDLLREARFYVDARATGSVKAAKVLDRIDTALPPAA
jgi:hypothetical protein